MKTITGGEETTSHSKVNEFTRRSFMQVLGSGILITTSTSVASAQLRSRRGQRGNIETRIHIGEDGTITVLTGKIDIGQGGRTELSQAAAEELKVSVDSIRMIMGDTDLVPNDGITAGSRTTPETMPVIREAAATARVLLIGMACDEWKVKPKAITVENGVITHSKTKRTISYTDLAKSKDMSKFYAASIPEDVEVTPVSEWKVMGKSVQKRNARDFVNGKHQFPSDIKLPGMLYGNVMRPPSYRAELVSVDLSEAKAMDDVVVVQEDDFIGCAAPTLFQARKAVAAIAKTAKWKTGSHPSSKELFKWLKDTSEPPEDEEEGRGSVKDGLAKSDKVARADYTVAYVQHTPMEPRAAVAEWDNDKLTVWTGTQGPFRVHGQLAETFNMAEKKVRVQMPDAGGGFGGKHSGECAVEAARLARAAKRPVSLRWSRKEEFIWAYFRPAALIEIEAGMDKKGSILAWDFTNINSGGSAIDTPYDIPNTRAQFRSADNPLRQGSYRCLAATANNFARESFMDELAAEAGKDPLAFRLDHLKNERLRDVLVAATKKFGWAKRLKKSGDGVGVGLACGTEKDSVVAACVEVKVDVKTGRIDVLQVCQAFECGAVVNPANLRSQVEGCIIMGLGPALTEEIQFENGKILNATLRKYPVPQFKDVPPIDIVQLDRKDLKSVGGSETPIIVIAPAIANAVFNATGIRVRSMPIRLDSKNITKA